MEPRKYALVQKKVSPNEACLLRVACNGLEKVFLLFLTRAYLSWRQNLTVGTNMNSNFSLSPGGVPGGRELEKWSSESSHWFRKKYP